MPFIRKPRQLVWTSHAKAKMGFYKLSEARVRRVLHMPRRKEEGVAPGTIAMMQPVSVHALRSKPPSLRKSKIPFGRTDAFQQTWSQEIWVMVEDHDERRTIISVWRYPGVSKVRSSVVLQIARQEYDEFIRKN